MAFEAEDTPATPIMTIGCNPLNDAEALRCIAHAMYLKIFTAGAGCTSVSYGCVLGETLLDGYIRRMIAGAAERFAVSSDERVREAGTNICARALGVGPDGEIDTSDLRMLSGRVSKDGDTASLLYWVNVAFGTQDTPSAEIVPVFLVRLDGSLYKGPSVEVPSSPVESFRGNVAFVRWLYATSLGYIDRDCPLTEYASEILVKVAVPLSPLTLTGCDETLITLLPLPNVVNAMFMLNTVFADVPDHMCELLRTISMRRFFACGQKEMAIAVNADELSGWISVITTDGAALQSDFAKAFAQSQGMLCNGNPIELAAVGQNDTFITAQETLSCGALEVIQRDDEDDSEDPITRDGAPDGTPDITEIDDTGSSFDNGMMGGENPDNQSDEDGRNRDGDAGETSEGNPFGDDQNPSGGEGNGDDPNANTGDDDRFGEDTIGLIDLDRTPVALDPTLYRSVVVELSQALDRDTELPVAQSVKTALREWCKSWLWLTSIHRTERYLTMLGLQRALKMFDSVQGKLG